MKQRNGEAAQASFGTSLSLKSNHRKRNQLIRAAGLTIAALGTSVGGLFSLSSAFAEPLVTTTHVDSPGEEGFLGIGTGPGTGGSNWSNGQEVGAGNDYEVLGQGQIRTPAYSSTTIGNLVFAGDALTLGDGTGTGTAGANGFGVLTFKGDVSGDTITINNLTLNSGILQTGGTSAGTSNSWTVASNNLVIGSGGFAIDNGGGQTPPRYVIIGANITGSGALQIVSNPRSAATASLTINGGSLVLTGNNSLWSGTELITGGVLQVGLGGSGATLGTGNVNVDNTLEFDTTTGSTYTQTFTVDSGQSGLITNVSTATQTLSGVTANGTLSLSNATGGLAFTGPIATSTSTLAITNGGGTISINGVTGTSTLIVGGTGTTTLTGTNSYSGDTTVNGGTLAFGSGARLPNSTNWTVAANAVLDTHLATGTLTTTSAGSISGSGTIIGNVTSAGQLSPGAGPATIGTLTINGNLGLTGGTLNTTLNATNTAPGGSTNDLVAVNGNLSLSGSIALNPTFTGGSAAVGNQYEIMSYSGSLSGTGTIAPQNRSITINTSTAHEILAIINTATAANLVWDSTSSSSWDVVTTPNWYNTGTAHNDDFYQADNVTFNDAYAGVQTNINIAQNVAPTSVTVNSTANTYTLGSTGGFGITGGATVNVTLGASNSLVITANNSYSGATTINSGTVVIGNGNASGSLGSGTVTNNGTIVYSRSDSPTVTTVFNGNGSIDVNSSTGGVTFNAASGYTGGLNVEDGVVLGGNANSFGAATSPITVTGENGAEIYSTAAVTYPQPITIGGVGPNDNGALRGGRSVTSAFSGAVTLDDNTIITDDGGAELNLTNTVTAPGDSLRVTGAGSLGFGGNVNLNGGEIQAASTIDFVPAASTTMTMYSPIVDGSSAGSINMNGAGTTVLSVDNGFSGAVTITNGVLEPMSANAIPAGNTINVIGGATETGELGLTTGSTGFTISNPITLNGRQGAAATNADVDNISGNNTLASTITATTSGNNYTIESDSGTLTVSGSFALSSAATGVRLLNLQGAGVGNWTGTIGDGSAGTTQLNVNGPGTWTLSNASGNSYSAGTVINAGTLVVANSTGSATGNGSITMNGGVLASASGASVALTGAVVAGTASHTIAPGGIGTIGTLTIGGLTTSSLTTLDFDLAAPVSSGNYFGDLLKIANSGSLTVGAGTPIAFGIDPTAPGDYRLIGGSFGSPTLANFTLPSAPAGDIYSLSTAVDSGYIDLVVAAGAASLSWDNAGASAPDDGKTWDTTSNNWNNGSSATTYANGNAVTFNDTNNGNYSVTLNTTVSPSSVTVNNSSGNYSITGAGEIVDTGAFTKSGAGSLTLGTALSASNLSISAGTLKLATNTTLGSGNPTSNINISSMSITGTGQLDITNNHIIIDYGSSDPMSTIYSYLKSGYNNGGWNGAGIISSTARTLTNGLKYGIGFSDGTDKLNGHTIVTGLSSGEIELKYTLLGDANLDGTVNGSDFSILAANFGQGYSNWDQGNFEYTPAVNGTDFSALAANFGQGDSGAAASVSQADIQALDAFAAANGLPAPTIAAVPEPVSTSILAAGAIGILARRQRRNR